MIKQRNAININDKPLIENKGCSQKKRFKSENNPKKQLFSISKQLHIHICRCLLQEINLKKRFFSLKNRGLRRGM